MPSPGLSRGARLLRRWRSLSDIRRIHPWRTAATVALWWPCCLLALAMRGIAWAGERVSGLDDAAERMLGAIRHWYQSEREYELRRRAYWRARMVKPYAYAAWNRRAETEGKETK